MPATLNEDDVARFGRDGILFPIRVYDDDEIGAKMGMLEALEAKRAGRLPPAMNAKPHLLVPWLWDMVHDPRIVDRVQDLLGPDLLCWGTSFISKYGADARYVAWHQDATYWGLTSPEAVTAWIAFTPSTRENGCVRVVPGTHRLAVAHTDGNDPDNLLGRGEKMVDDVDDNAAVDVVLAPGEMSLHHALIVHGSEPNTSGLRRTGFAIRYIPGHVGQVAGARNSATLVRGENRGGFDLEQAPEAAFHPDAMARHGKILRNAMAIIFKGKKAAQRADLPPQD